MLGICLGPVKVSIAALCRVIWGQFFPVTGGEAGYTRLEYSIVWLLRLPRVLLGAVVGASLALCGVAMQALVRNKLADPFVLGVSSGASATATLGMLFGTFRLLGRFSLPLSAFIGAVFTIAIVYMLARVDGRINIPQLLLSGVAVSMMMGALTSIITLSAPNALGLHSVTFWMSGSLAGARWEYLTLPAAVMLVCMAILLVNYRTLNGLLLGDDTALTLGISVSSVQKWLVLIASLLAGVTISVSGSIGFIGLMVPHIARMIVGANHKRVLPLCVFLGAILVIWADVAARLILAPEEMPVGLLTSLVGGPFFIILLKKERKGRAEL
jgi:iron complex transport system permease protein